MNLCTCPAAASLTAIDAVTCPQTFGQIQKIAFQRLRQANGTKNSFTNSASILLLASWQAKMSAADGTKIVISPYVQAPTQEAGGPRTFGGGNETLGGVEEIIGREPSTFKAVLRSVPQNIIAQLKKLQCEAQGGNLGVYLIDENGAIEAIQDSATATTFYPIPIRSLFIGDKAHGGLEAPDSNAIQFSFLPNYSDQLSIQVPTNFNPLTDL